MANIIQIKRSSNTGEVPHFNELAVGELAVNLADGILFTKATSDGDADDVIRLGGDNYSLANASTGSGSSAGARITLNRSTTGSGGGTQVADGTFDIIGSSSVSVTHSSGQVVLAVAGGAAINKLQSDDGGSDFAVPSSGVATIAGGTGITTSDSGATLTVTADLSLTNTATMTNKTLTAPIINGAGIIFEGATADDFETTLAVTDPTADRTITLPNVTGTVVTTGDTGSVTNTMLAGSIANAKLVNSTITVSGDNNSATLDLGGSLKIGSNDAALTSSASTTGGGVDQVMFSVNVDDSSIEIDGTNGLQVKASGVTQQMLAGSIPDSKLSTISTVNKVSISALNIDGSSDTLATLADDDKFIVDDDTDGVNHKMSASVLKTYLGVGTGNFPIANLDVDGGTDKAAPVVGDEVVIADSEASGATKKADIGSILDIISGDVAVDASGVATIQANAVALGTDTTGNYIATLADAGNDFTISNSGAESAAVTIALGNADGDVSVARDLSVTRNLDINGATISLGASTSTTTVEDNLVVVGDLTVNGTTTTVNTSTLQVSDPLIQLADGNTGGDALDIGFFGEYADSGNQRHAGFVRDASLTALNGATHKGSYVLFSNGTVAPTTTFDASGTYDYGALVLQHLAFGTNSASAVGNATTTPHVLAAGGTTLSHTDGFAAPGQIKRFTMDNCIIDGGSFDGSA